MHLIAQSKNFDPTRLRNQNTDAKMSSTTSTIHKKRQILGIHTQKQDIYTEFIISKLYFVN